VVARAPAVAGRKPIEATSVLARQEAELPEAPPPAPAPAAPAPPAAGAGADPDELYEQMIERLRRDLLDERERMGDLVGGF
jgi:hypothetical protein